MKAYTVEYKLTANGETRFVPLLAGNKQSAWVKATFEIIPEKEGQQPYSSWVASVTYNNGKFRRFNTWEGLPY